MILCDTGVLICLIDPTQAKHSAYQNKVAGLTQSLTTTWPCLTEAMYLALRRGGWKMQKQLGSLLLNKLLTVYPIDADGYERLFQLMEKYRDRPMDLADASLVLAAEKTGYRQILTLDSDFLFYRIDDRNSFEVIQVQ